VHKNCLDTVSFCIIYYALWYLKRCFRKARSDEVATLLVGRVKDRIKCHQIFFTEFFNAMCYRWNPDNTQNKWYLPEDNRKEIAIFVK